MSLKVPHGTQFGVSELLGKMIPYLCKFVSNLMLSRLYMSHPWGKVLLCIRRLLLCCFLWLSENGIPYLYTIRAFPGVRINQKLSKLFAVHCVRVVPYLGRDWLLYQKYICQHRAKKPFHGNFKTSFFNLSSQDALIWVTVLHEKDSRLSSSQIWIPKNFNCFWCCESSFGDFWTFRKQPADKWLISSSKGITESFQIWHFPSVLKGYHRGDCVVQFSFNTHGYA